MADVKVPIKFEIYKGDALVREETLAQDVIKVGKLASSHLRIDDETVSRMHAVIEVTGAGRDPHHRPRLDARDARQRGAHQQDAPPVGRRDHVRRQPRSRHVPRGAAGADAAPGGAAPRVGQKTSLGIAPPPGGFAPPPGYVPSAPQAQFAPPRGAGYVPPPAVAATRRPPAAAATAAARWAASAEVEVMDGSRAMEVQTVFRGVVTGTRHLFNPEGKSTHGQGTTMLYAGLALALVGIIAFCRDGHGRRRREGALRGVDERWPGRQDLRVEDPLSRPAASSCSAASRSACASRTWASSGAARRARTSSSARTPRSTRRCRPSTCRRPRTRSSRRRARTTWSTSPRA